MGVVLDVKDLEVSFFGERGETKAVKNVSFHVDEGEIFGIVGESGSGKSVATKAILRLGHENCKIKNGSIFFEKESILDKSDSELRKIRGSRISIIFQDSQSSLNPVYTIGSKLIEVIRRHSRMTKKQARTRALELLESVGITDAEKNLKSYPHELSGGMRQRVMIAMAISSNPRLIIADEPTTALDVTIQAQILHLLRGLQKKSGTSVILITHDLGVVAQMCSRIAVMCGGYIVEEGTADDIFSNPLHPYTQALIASMPKPGWNPEQFVEKGDDDSRDEALCPFLSRCKYAGELCRNTLPEIYCDGGQHCARCHIRRSHGREFDYSEGPENAFQAKAEGTHCV